jgi:hypothetical protein
MHSAAYISIASKQYVIALQLNGMECRCRV